MNTVKISYTTEWGPGFGSPFPGSRDSSCSELSGAHLECAPNDACVEAYPSQPQPPSYSPGSEGTGFPLELKVARFLPPA